MIVLIELLLAFSFSVCGAITDHTDALQQMPQGKRGKDKRGEHAFWYRTKRNAFPFEFTA